MISILITALVFANSVFASSMNSSIVGLHEILIKNFKSGVDVSCDNARSLDSLKIDVSLLTKGRCGIREATASEKYNYSGIGTMRTVAKDNSASNGTVNLVYNDDVGVSRNDNRFLLTALHILHVDKAKDQFPVVVDKRDPFQRLVYIKECRESYKVIGICIQSPSDAKPDDDFGFLVLDRPACVNAKALEMKEQTSESVGKCDNVHVTGVLTPGLECGTQKNRDDLTPYVPVSPNIAGRELFIGDGVVKRANTVNNLFSYTADSAHGSSGGAVVCGGENNSGKLVGVHIGGGNPGENIGIKVSDRMVSVLKNCAEKNKIK